MSILDFVCLGRENPEQIEAFAHLIPKELLPELRAGALLGIGSLLGDFPNGAAVFALEGESAQLRSLYVDEYDRRHGVGSELVEELCNKLRELGGVYSLQLRLSQGGDIGVSEFLSKNGFELYEGESSEAYISLAALKTLGLPAPKLETISGEALDESVLRRLEADLKSKDLYFLEGSLSEEPVKRELCRYTVENGAVTAAAIVTGDAPLSLAYLFGDNAAAIASVLYDARAEVLSRYGEDTLLYLDAVSESGSKLAQRLLGADKLLKKSFARKAI